MQKWFELALAEIGTKESPGYANNPIIQKYYVDAGSGKLPDSVPWCAAFVGAMLKRAGIAPSGYLAARSYLNWGVRLKSPVQGCIVVFSRGRPPQGHVAFFDSFTADGRLRVVGGNQSDAVSYAKYPKARVLGYRWPLGVPVPKGKAK